MKRILVTGGAGFIGSNLAEALCNHPEVELVRVLDNLSTGSYSNIETLNGHPKFEFIQGDIRSQEDCIKACRGIDAISHQAALGSVPRSIADPRTTHEVNVNGFFNILEAMRTLGIKRIVYASSSSVYGDLNESPKVEERVGKVLSPYAASKMTNELYAEAYSRQYNVAIIGFRYFNVFGPRQSPEGPYAAVIPLFINAVKRNIQPTINGNGSISRDFTPVRNVIHANISGLLSTKVFKHSVYNVACGKSTSLIELWNEIQMASGVKISPKFGKERPGDIFQSLADISKIINDLEYKPSINWTNDLKELLNE